MTSQAQLERLLGWNLLIPPRTGRLVHLDGFPPGAAIVWADKRDEHPVDDPNKADLRLYWNNRPRVQSGPDGYVVVGNGPGKASNAKAYALIPPSDPRLVLPLGNRCQLLRGLKMHRPGRRIARVAVWLLTLGVRLGVTQPLKRRVLWIGLSHGKDFPIVPADSVLYLGTADDNRKTTILPPDPGSIIKHGTGSRPIASLCNEADALTFLAKTTLANRIPRVIDFHHNDRIAVLTQEYRAPIGCDRQQHGREISEFLKDLSKVGFKTRDGVPGHRCHGDFAPWNIIHTTSGVFVFDWEDSRDWAPALTDAFYFSTASYLKVDQRVDLGALIVSTLRFAADIGQEQGLAQEEVRKLWRQWLEYRARTKPCPRISALLMAEKETVW